MVGRVNDITIARHVLLVGRVNDKLRNNVIYPIVGVYNDPQYQMTPGQCTLVYVDPGVIVR